MHKWAFSVKAGHPIQIQYRQHNTDTWKDVSDNPEWCNHSEYREKPRPREFWAIIRPVTRCSCGHLYETLEDAKSWFPNDRPVKVRVVEE
jgi:hypothetical protein